MSANKVEFWMLAEVGLVFSVGGSAIVPVRWYGVTYDEDSWQLLLAPLAYATHSIIKRKHERAAVDPETPDNIDCLAMSQALTLVTGKVYSVLQVCFPVNLVIV